MSAGRAALEGMERFEWSRDPTYSIKKKKQINIELKVQKQNKKPGTGKWGLIIIVAQDGVEMLFLILPFCQSASLYENM